MRNLVYTQIKPNHFGLGIMVLLLLFGFGSVAGNDWISSGGETFRLEKNPWFVRNTKEVLYCIEIDSAGISVSDGKIRTSIREAIDYWKSEFGKSHRETSRGFLKLATQNFLYQKDCGRDTADLVFKFGFNTLSSEESKFLEDPTKYIGVAVRTSEYDKVAMRASGFIFVSSDIGPNSYRNKGQLVSEAWSKPNLLTYVLIHELGHVFGIPHSGSGIMSEVFMDELLHKRLHKEYLSRPLKSYLHPPKTAQVGSFTGSFDRDYLGAPKKTSGIKIVQKGLREYKVFAIGPAQSPWEEELGTFRLTNEQGKLFSQEPSTRVHLPDEQEVFSIQEQFLNSYLMGPVFTRVSGTGTFSKKGSRKPYPVYIELKPESMTFVSLELGQTKSILVYSGKRLFQLGIGL